MMQNVEFSAGTKNAKDYKLISKLSIDESTAARSDTGEPLTECAIIDNNAIMEHVLEIRNVQENLKHISLMTVSIQPYGDAVSMSIGLYQFDKRGGLRSYTQIYVASFFRIAAEQETAKEIICYLNGFSET